MPVSNPHYIPKKLIKHLGELLGFKSNDEFGFGDKKIDVVWQKDNEIVNTFEIIHFSRKYIEGEKIREDVEGALKLNPDRHIQIVIGNKRNQYYEKKLRKIEEEYSNVYTIFIEKKEESEEMSELFLKKIKEEFDKGTYKRKKLKNEIADLLQITPRQGTNYINKCIDEGIMERINRTTVKKVK